MSCTSCKTTQFHAQWIRLRGERAQWAITNNYSVCIATELGSRRTILQIIFPIMLRHPCAFNKRVKESVIHMLPKPLPSIAPVFEEVHFASCCFRLYGLPVKFYSIQRVAIAASIVHIQLTVIISKESGIPAT